MRHHQEVRWEGLWFSSACAAQSSCSVETLCSKNNPILFFLQIGKLLSNCGPWDATETQRHIINFFHCPLCMVWGLIYHLYKHSFSKQTNRWIRLFLCLMTCKYWKLKMLNLTEEFLNLGALDVCRFLFELLYFSTSSSVELQKFVFWPLLG